MMRKKNKDRRIVVAVDESEESMYALSWCLTNLLSQQAKTNNINNTTIVLLYVKPPPPAYSSMDPTGYLFGGDVVATMEKYSRDLANSVMNRAEEVYGAFNTTTIKVEKKIGSGDAKNVICVAVEKLAADVLVMGSHDYGFFKRALLGSVSDYCSKHVKCPLVVVKRPKNA
ncbi:universal stress protein PHOS32 isoform X2 [Rhododendron vialii]|uniref:universal stress protein PHOS32 isoform X2 n=1 Tax=Rhododendron vialii TaxID=182163 RepID=UPI00265D6D26|nr:universal stress protein PHOS32 isoform X2 [Rhododendron vialii]